MTRALGYARVSTAEQQQSGMSLDAQTYQIRYHAAGQNTPVVDVVCEQGSGKDLNRPELQHALERLVNGGADSLIVTRLDRLTRSLADFIVLLEWFQHAGKHLVVLDFDLDTSTPAGELIAHMMAALAQWQRRVIADNTRNALAEKRRQGQPINQGAVTDRPELAAEIRNMHSAGSSYRQICEYLNANRVPTIRGGAAWRPSALSAALGVQPRPRRRATTLPSV